MAQAFKELRNIVNGKGSICVRLIVAVQGFESFFVLFSWKDGFGIFSMQPKYPKSGKARHVPVADKVKPIVLEHLEGKDPDDLVFTTRSGAKLNKGNVKRDTHWKELSQGRRLHDLRHTAATEWLRHGIDVLTVKEWLGHSSLAMTQRYVHYLGTDADIAAIKKLNR